MSGFRHFGSRAHAWGLPGPHGCGFAIPLAGAGGEEDRQLITEPVSVPLADAYDLGGLASSSTPAQVVPSISAHSSRLGAA